MAPPPPVLRPPATLIPAAPVRPRPQAPVLRWQEPPPELPSINRIPQVPDASIGPLAGQDHGLEDRYRRAVEAQERLLRTFQLP